MRKIVYRLAAGPAVDRLNRDLLRVAAAEKPDLLWTDKLLWMRPKTLDKMRAMGIATVSYMIDNPFGPRQDPGWRLYMKDIPHYDLHVVQRDKNILDYTSTVLATSSRSRRLMSRPSTFLRLPDGATRTATAGSPSSERPTINAPRFLTRLWKEFGLPVTVSGGLVWKPALGRRQWRRSIAGWRTVPR